MGKGRKLFVKIFADQRHRYRYSNCQPRAESGNSFGPARSIASHCDGNKYNTPRRAPCHDTIIIKIENAPNRTISTAIIRRSSRYSASCLRLSKDFCSASSRLTEWKTTFLAPFMVQLPKSDWS